VIETLDFLVRFWELSARHATLGYPLAPSEQLELLSLMQLVNGDRDLTSVDSTDDASNGLPAQLIGEGAIVAVEMRAVSASGVQVVSEGTVPCGAHVVVRATDAVSGVEYVLPCTVARVTAGAPNTMTLVVDGIPSRKTFFSPEAALARTSVRFGRHQRLVG
jgi:hypothetical protein